MSLPFSIGVEIEFLVAYAREHQGIEDDGKFLRFTTEAGQDDSDEILVPAHNMGKLIHYHIAHQIHELHLPIYVNNPNSGDYSQWQVAPDCSIKAHGLDNEDFDPTRRREVGVEVKTPILNFSHESFRVIEDVSLMLNSKYQVRNNQSTGLHVHIGHYPETFSFGAIKKLIAFLYTFEPQLSSLHPKHRMSNISCQSMRERCEFTNAFQRRHGFFPTPSNFTAAIMSETDDAEIFDHIRDMGNLKCMHYNFQGQAFTEGEKKTIEFRQHEGTTDADAINNWINVIVAIVKFCEEGHPESFRELLRCAHKSEKWEYLCDGKHEERKETFGPILAHHGFTIIDLLQYLGCDAQATYYEDKWALHVPYDRLIIRQEPVVTWEYEEWDDKSDEYKNAKARRQQWERQQIAQEIRTMAGLPPLSAFDPDDAKWPTRQVGSNPGSPVNIEDLSLFDFGDTEASEAWGGPEPAKKSEEPGKPAGQDEHWDTYKDTVPLW